MSPISITEAHHAASCDFVVSVRGAVNDHRSKMYSPDVCLDRFVTKIVFDETVTPLRATIVEVLDGKTLYKASPKSGSAASSIAGTATASQELGSVKPAETLQTFNTSVISHLPGVGTNF
ncbi:GMC oxidoreductase [Pleomassaria siparia CBS 279.74]|uniref:GMC oxidoreductase n=1 Tax=Pleomassaria siparia CBS 279.74 TaxID=1314801 RepID=A0A6G1JXF3_9PLEO|nr:GMC oxidoreductase [Pleomassaria siparia CBS 279.74]